jgi:hypothetical protein
MIRKAFITGILAAGMAFTAFHSPSVCERIASSARDFRQYFHALNGDTVGPVQRFVLSLVLANGKQAHSPAHTTAAQHRS